MERRLRRLHRYYEGIKVTLVSPDSRTLDEKLQSYEPNEEAYWSLIRSSLTDSVGGTSQPLEKLVHRLLLVCGADYRDGRVFRKGPLDRGQLGRGCERSGQAIRYHVEALNNAGQH